MRRVREPQVEDPQLLAFQGLHLTSTLESHLYRAWHINIQTDAYLFAPDFSEGDSKRPVPGHEFDRKRQMQTLPTQLFLTPV